MRFKHEADKQKLLKELCSDDMKVRMQAAFALVEFGSTEVVPALVKELNNGSGFFWAAPALANIGCSEAVAGLIEALNNKDRAVRVYAASALGAITEPKVVCALIEALNDEYKTVRENAASSLAMIGKPSIPALLDALNSKHATVRANAASVLGNIGDPNTMPDLVKALADKSGLVRIAAVSAIAAVFACLRSDCRYSFLAKIGKPAVPALIQALGDKYRRVRANAASALGNIGDTNAKSHLMQALKDEEEIVRDSADYALKKISTWGFLTSRIRKT